MKNPDSGSLAERVNLSIHLGDVKRNLIEQLIQKSGHPEFYRKYVRPQDITVSVHIDNDNGVLHFGLLYIGGEK